MSVFGRRHNDHVWIEIQDRATGEWFPADPSLGVVGEQAWIAARLGFAERFSLDPSSKDMIAPFAVFATDSEGRLSRDRTQQYVIDGFDRLYDGQLSQLAAWPQWVRLVNELNDPALGAFRGEINLHDFQPQIDALASCLPAATPSVREPRQQETLRLSSSGLAIADRSLPER